MTLNPGKKKPKQPDGKKPAPKQQDDPEPVNTSTWNGMPGSVDQPQFPTDHPYYHQ